MHADTIDPALVAEYRRMNTEGSNFKGLSVLQQEKIIGKLIARTGAQTLLDYGCALAEAYAEPHRLHRRWGVARPVLYDPAVPAYANKPPGTYDGVICSDVLEHIPERHVDAVIAELFRYAEKMLFASVCCRPAKKLFADGVTNLHVTIQPFAWWKAKFEAQAALKPALVWHLKETP